jgi:hypothetical protein
MSSVAWVRGLTCEDVIFDAATWEWIFRFGSGVSLRVAAPWRIMGRGRIELGYEDHGQQFGLPRPVDGVASARDLLRGRSVIELSVAATSWDATIDFGNGCQLQVFNSSSGYEGWTLIGPEGRQVVAQGGGHLVEIPDAAP